jgi:hypothetical protein
MFGNVKHTSLFHLSVNSAPEMFYNNKPIKGKCLVLDTFLIGKLDR